MKSLKALWRTVAVQLATDNCTSAVRDYKTVTDRVEHEGSSFLTITLPAFGKEFERALESGQVDSSYWPGFSRRGRGPLPVFLGGFLSQVFDACSGRLLDEPNVDCIFAIRQLTQMYAKILLPCSDIRTRGAIKGYVECEQEVELALKERSQESSERFRRVSALLWSDVLAELENKLYQGTLTPKHGPGATADKLRGNAKFDQHEWTLRLEQSGFPFGDYVLPNWRFASELERVNFLEPEAERPVKVITVPKTLKTPRIIAVEPTCMQYTQQAIAMELVSLLESVHIGINSRCNAPFGQIGFTDQMPNQHLAAVGSLTGTVATLDLSEASDRVSTGHVEDLLSLFPLVLDAVMATRSTKAQVPGYGVLSLSKFASMGSALCFPIEAMVFLTVVYCGIEQQLNRRLTRRDVLSFSGQVRVYGDDIIVPTDYVHSVIRSLEDFSFRVNASKSFWNGKFRESCGGDFYDGTDVTPVRVRHELPESHGNVRDHEHATRVRSLVSLRNQLYERGLWRAVEYLDGIVGEVLPHFPIVDPTSPVFGRRSFLGWKAERECPRLHRPLVRGYVSASTPPASNVSGVGALLKVFLKQGVEPFADKKHLERSGRPDAVGLKLRWTAPY